MRDDVDTGLVAFAIFLVPIWLLVGLASLLLARGHPEAHLALAIFWAVLTLAVGLIGLGIVRGFGMYSQWPEVGLPVEDQAEDEVVVLGCLPLEAGSGELVEVSAGDPALTDGSEVAAGVGAADNVFQFPQREHVAGLGGLGQTANLVGDETVFFSGSIYTSRVSSWDMPTSSLDGENTNTHVPGDSHPADTVVSGRLYQSALLLIDNFPKLGN